MTTLESAGATLTYQLDGTAGPVLSLAHGWCSQLEHWQPQADAFSATHRVLRWDRRGMARSQTDVPALNPEQHADDLAALLDHLGLGRTTIIGHAGGAPSAVAFAARHADRTDALVVVDTLMRRAPAPGEPDPFAETIEALAANLERADGRDYLATLYPSFFGSRAAPALVEAAVANALRTPLSVAATEVRHMCIDAGAWADQVTCPVLWVSAQPTDTEAIRALFPAAAIGHVVGSGHFVQLEVPEQFNAMLSTFLDQQPATAVSPR
ncbi:MAG: alpha/beta fold hydrolase [Acidimicrobiales bacterium]